MNRLVRMERQISVGIFGVTSRDGPGCSSGKEAKRTFPFVGLPTEISGIFAIIGSTPNQLQSVWIQNADFDFTTET